MKLSRAFTVSVLAIGFLGVVSPALAAPDEVREAREPSTANPAKDEPVGARRSRARV